MKHIPLAIITVILGFVFVGIFSAIFDGNSVEFSYYSAIILLENPNEIIDFWIMNFG